jgi:peptidylprolyl isomerase
MLVLSGCGGGDDSGSKALSDVKVSGAAGKEPKLEVEKGFEVDKTSTKVIEEGDGDELKDGDVVKLSYVAYNGRTAKEVDNSWKADQRLVATLKEGSILSGFVKGLTGQKVGSRVLVGIPPKDGFGQDNAQLDLKKDDSMVFVFDVLQKLPTEASGTAQKVPATVPAVQLDADGHPKGFKATKKTPQKVTKQAAYVAIKGDGPKVEAKQTITIHYTGQVYPSGEIFDESWSKGTPFTSTIGTGQLIPCWDQLIGQTVGSRVLLVCPADTAYGDQGQGAIKPGDTLQFAVDVLDAD